jgi:hypothetical protein
MAERQQFEDAQRREMKKRAMAEARRKRALDYKPPSSPPPVDGRTHAQIQTEEDQLEEITDRPIEFDATTQTGFLVLSCFLDLCSSVLFVSLASAELDEEKPLPVFVEKPMGKSRYTWIDPGSFLFSSSLFPFLSPHTHPPFLFCFCLSRRFV